MNNKKTVMAFSALLILIFHLWVNIFPGNIAETFIKQTAYIGVDMFFCISGYSLANRKIQSYGQFIGNRFIQVYLKYIIFALIAMVYGKWPFGRFISVIIGRELYIKGGGAFLWFVPVIMLFYIVFPLFSFCDNKNRWATAIVTSLIWIGIALVVTMATDNKTIFIYWNRIPIFLFGYYWGINASGKLSKKAQIIAGLSLTIAGYILLFDFGFRAKLQVPIRDMFYVVGIVASVGLICLLTMIPEIKPISIIGSSTLELYAVQMIFGYALTNKLLKSCSIPLTNIFMILIMVVSAVVMHYVLDFVLKKMRLISH